MARRSSREWLARFAAPVLFLLAVTIAVMLVRAALREGDESGQSPAPSTRRAAPTARSPSATKASPQRRRQRPPPPRGNVYVIKAGDTFETVAEQYGTTIEELRELNPGVDPFALAIGQRIRVP